MKKFSKKELILSILLVVVLTLTIFLIIFVMFHKEEKNNYSELKEIISKINDINEIYKTIDLEDNTKYIKHDDVVCYKYNGEDTEKYIKKINDLYSYPISWNGGFDINYLNKEDGSIQKDLYACKKESCQIIEITEYDFRDLKEDMKEFTINDTNHVMHLENDEWKFYMPVLVCKK